MSRHHRWAGRVLAALSIVALLAAPVRGQEPLTRPERTGGLETSRYADVMAFIDSVADAPVVHHTTFGYSYEGRPLPLVVVGTDLPDGSAESVRATGRARVLVMANIHAGEVEGKEAAQILLRRFAAGEHRSWLDSLVVLVAPIYNADGNERVSVSNRFRQNGPFGGVGERANAQGLDLNRDHTKLESPEARSLVQLMNTYDPHLVVDLHTTNGTYHGYHLTYAPPLHPNTEAGLVTFLRERLLPAVTESIATEYGWNFYYYGNAYAPEGGDRGWYTYSHMPRYNSNYVGLRNRLAILSESYAYVEFGDRILSTLAFVEEILEVAHGRAGEIDRLVRAADATDLRGLRLALRATYAAGERVEILMGEVEERLSTYSGRRYRARLDRIRPETMREYGTFRATETGVAPAAYYVPAALMPVLDLLALHGIETTRLPASQMLELERFVVDSTRVSPREYQGHRQRQVFGGWRSEDVVLAEGTVVVPMDQPLARLVFALLEPRSDDGVVSWNLVDGSLMTDDPSYPILRRPASTR